MKSLVNYILEQQEDVTTIKDLRIPYDCPDQVNLQVPTRYGESDIQIYMDDTLLQALPLSNQDVLKNLGKNSKQINDLYFEYDKMEPALGKNEKADVEWDEHYDPKDDDELNIVKITGLKYVVNFNKFELTDVNEDILDIIYNLFNGYVSETNKELPFEITLNKDNIEYKE